MSVNSLVRMAVANAAPISAAPAAAPAAAAAAVQPSTTPAAPSVSITAMVPTEVVLFYTSIIGVLDGVLKDYPKADYLPLRWGILAGGVAAVAIAILVPFFHAKTQAGNQLGAKKLPTLPLVGGEVSFVVWALVVPGSALYYQVTAPTLPVLVGVISAIGVFLAAAVFRPLGLTS